MVVLEWGTAVGLAWTGWSVQLANRYNIDTKISSKWFARINAITLLLNLVDKVAVVYLSPWRIPELLLHLLSACGGAPSTVLSMFIFNHKSTKASFQFSFKKMCLVNLALIFGRIILLI